VAESPADEPLPTVGGAACGYFTDVALFGGPATRRGCDQTVPPGSARSASPSVTLPAGGSSTAVAAAAPGGALAEYGPAVIFGGRPPANPDAPIPPCGTLRVSTKGKRSITSTASAKNVGPGPFVADAVRSTCNASKSGVTGSTTITRGVLVTATDADGNPLTTDAVPTHPPVNHTVKGKTSNGDRFKAVFNEQKVNRDGSITVDAVHLYLLGPTAKGDIVIARTSCRA
jgi:hypothetical protein